MTAKERPGGVVFGTDYAQCSVEKHIALVKSLELSDEAKERIFFKNALQLFKLSRALEPV
jgi:predicted TIM-barrel fold metal-dependent hydrolase